MSDTRHLIRVFLASPGDLTEERRAAKSVVDDFNSLWADEFGYQLELVGWEDTVAVFGRPQATINRELEHCELFVGLMWKRWGTPPDTTGRYTSGFEEEFRTSIERRTREGRPEISLFFKDIPAEFLRDPGDDLKKVLAFRGEIIAKKTLLFETFTETREFERKLFRCISAYVRRRTREDREGAPNLAQAPASDGRNLSESEAGGTRKTPLSAQGATFLRDFLSRLEVSDAAERVSPADVARFRLLSSAVASQGNDEPSLGVHDANLLFHNRGNFDFGPAELHALLARGLEHFSNENVPAWHWLAAVGGFERSTLQMSSLVGASAARRSGALRAMTILRQDIPTGEDVERSWFVDSWLTKDAPAPVRLAALTYLAECGISADLAALRDEFDRGDSQTTSAAAEAILKIGLRDSRQNAVLSLYDLQATTVRTDVVNTIFADGAGVDSSILLRGLEDRNADVRIAAAAILRRRRALPEETADKLLSDSNPQVRYEALCSLRDSGRLITSDQARAVLVRRPVPDIFRLRSEGEKQLSAFEYERLASLPDRELETLAKSGPISSADAYFVLAERQFAKYATALRNDIDDQYASEFLCHLQEVGTAVGEGHELIAQWRALGDFTRKQETRRALDVICHKGLPEDLPRVRKALGTGFVDFSSADIEFLRRLGEWADIPLITEAVKRPVAGRTSTLLTPDSGEKYQVGARALYSLGRSRLPELLALPMRHELLVQLIINIPSSAFRQLDDAPIELLLRSEHDAVRKIAAVKSVAVLGSKRVARLLSRHISSDQYYYNIVHWLDLGASAPARMASKSAARILQQSA
jgi:hypothetical protein